MSRLQNIIGNKTFLCIISGLFLGLAFPPVNMYYLAFFGFAIYAYIVTSSKTYKEVMKRSFLIFFIWELYTVSWVPLSGFTKPDYFMVIGGLLILILHPIVYYIPLTLTYFFIVKHLKVKRYPNLTLIFLPIVWVAFEYLQTTNQVTFPWLTLGYTETYNLEKIQYIEYTGIYGISAWICSIGVMIFYLFRKISEREWKLRSPKALGLAAGIVLLYFLPNVYNGVTSSKEIYTDNKSDGSIRVGVIQPNKNPWFKWEADHFRITNDYVDIMKELVRTEPKPDLLIMPETSLPYHLRWNWNDSKLKIITDFVDKEGIPLLVGAPDLYYYPEGAYVPPDAREFNKSKKKYDVFNTAFLIEKGTGKDSFQVHNKSRLVIGSERIPYQESIPFLKDIVPWAVGIGSFQMGTDTTLFNLDGKYKFNVAICYESVYPQDYADYINKGADFSVIITNDGWWGKLFGTYQHNQYAVLRAIENRRWIARSANTGISCVIDPYGNFYDETPINERRFFNAGIGIRKEKTFYTMNGDVFALVIMYVCILSFTLALVMRDKRKHYW